MSIAIQAVRRTLCVGGAALLLIAVVAPAALADARCHDGEFALGDARDIAAIRAVAERECPCATFDGSTTAKNHGAYVRCTKAVINDASDGTPVLGAYSVRGKCKGELKKIFRKAGCGYAPARVMCCQKRLSSGKVKGRALQPEKCTDSESGAVLRNACWVSPFDVDACRLDTTNECTSLVARETIDIASSAEPAETPGSSGVVVTSPKLLAQFGGGSFSLNNARYTRHHLAGPSQEPDAILILVPGFEGGAGDFHVLAEELITRAHGEGFVLEVWAFDRRTNQLEDMAGLDLSEEFLDPQIALDWLYGGELGLALHPILAAGPNRRAVFHNAQGDVPFIANWTNLVFSQDIDAVVEAALPVARNQNVFLGGHSAGAGFTARYASTDFNLTGIGPAEPGYAKLRGLVMLEGGAGSLNAVPPSADTLDRIEAKFDGGLFGAVRDNAARCVDGVTPCTIATEAADCVGQMPPKCTLPTAAYAVSSLLNPRILAAGEMSAIQGVLDPDGGQNLVSVDQGSPGNNPPAVVPDLAPLQLVPSVCIDGVTSCTVSSQAVACAGQTPPTCTPPTAYGGLGGFVDDDGLIALVAPFVATSVGAPGPIVDGLRSWQDITEGPLPVGVLPNNGAPPPSLTPPILAWGQEKEVTRLDRLGASFYKGGTGFTDLYYPSSGLSVTSVSGVCSANTCIVGSVGEACTMDSQCSQSVGLDSSALSIGRGRRDIENLTQAANIDIPVISFCASNGAARVPGVMTPFANSIGTCTAPSCDGTPRVVDATMPNPAFPTFGDIAGGYEVVVVEGFAHVDVLTAEDDVNNPVPAALVAFLERNSP